MLTSLTSQPTETQILPGSFNKTVDILKSPGSKVVTGLCALSCVLLSTTETEAATLANYPFTKAQFDGQIGIVASQNGGTRVVAARTLTVTNNLQNHSGEFQIDLVTTLSQSNLNVMNANTVTSASFYVAPTVAAYNAGNYTELFSVNLNNFVDPQGNPIQTQPAPGGYQFTPTVDLGSAQGSPNIGFTFLTDVSQTGLLHNWFDTLSLNSTAVIGISFDAVSEDGIMRVVTSTVDLGNDTVAFGTTLSNLSLGMNLTASTPVIPEPTVALQGAIAAAGFILRRNREQ